MTAPGSLAAMRCVVTHNSSQWTEFCNLTEAYQWQSNFPGAEKDVLCSMSSAGSKWVPTNDVCMLKPTTIESPSSSSTTSTQFTYKEAATTTSAAPAQSTVGTEAISSKGFSQSCILTRAVVHGGHSSFQTLMP